MLDVQEIHIILHQNLWIQLFIIYPHLAFGDQSSHQISWEDVIVTQDNIIDLFSPPTDDVVQVCTILASDGDQIPEENKVAENEALDLIPCHSL